MIEKLKKDINSGITALGIGPMSRNIVDASIEIADDYDIPVMLIASRRQIDSKNIQRGYVCNWSTEEFADYVKLKQKKKNIILARDHGGPWQNNVEISKKLSLKDAMKSAKDSYIVDIESGFSIIHLDPSIDIFHQLSFDKIFERLQELYLFCSDYAQKVNRDIEFEVGTEEQMIYSNSLLEFQSMLEKIKNFCLDSSLKEPLFVVSQIGTKVMEMKNIGLLNQENNEKLKSQIVQLCEVAKKHGFYVKVHNSDYLQKNIIQEFPSFGISAANIAPEFGVCESISFLKLLEEHYLFELANEFLELSYNSKKWDKWLIVGSRISRRDKALISGHYVYSTDEFKTIKEKAQKQINNFDIDSYLKNSVKRLILDYMIKFGYKNIREKKFVSIN